MGLEHGKIGDRIAVVLNGQQIYKKLCKPTQNMLFSSFVFTGGRATGVAARIGTAT